MLSHQRVKKASQSLQSWAAKKIQIIFCRGVYLIENTSQAASAEFVRLRRTNYAHGRLQKLPEKPEVFFDSPRLMKAAHLLVFYKLEVKLGSA